MLYLGLSFHLFSKIIAPIYSHYYLLFYYSSDTGLSNIYNIGFALIETKYMFPHTTCAHYEGSISVVAVAFCIAPSVSTEQTF
jgi:hypothetical protein